MENPAINSSVNKMVLSKASSLTDGSLILGREADKRMTLEFLLSNDRNDSHNVSVVCMVGPNGIGKTTMVHLIYTHKRIEDAFNTRIFIGMFEEKFDEKRLMKEMIQSLTRIPCDVTEPEVLEDILKDELSGKKLLLVLDSAVNENKSFWDNLLVLLNCVAKGSIIIVTTSKEGVANCSGPMHCYKLGHLSDRNCWLIFQKLAFRATYMFTNHRLVNIGKYLIIKCGYNTLCIKMLGGLLSYFLTEEGWRSVLVLLESDFWDVDKPGKKIMPVLRVCYELLPSHLKRCFTYCSLFPKGYIFSKHYLVSLWVSQDFVEPVEGKDLDDIGFGYFEELCSRSFFNRSLLHDAKDDKFVMHELIHDLAQYVSKNEYFRSEDCSYIVENNVHHFSLVPDGYQTVKSNLIVSGAKYLQSFLVINRFVFQLDNTLSSVLNLMNLDGLFEKVTRLRTLDLSNTDLEKLPGSIKLLRNLFYLGLSRTNISSIPSEIDNLVNLQTLEAQNCYNLFELPENIQGLSNLHHLDISKKAGFVGMPIGIGKLTTLQSLAAFNVGSDDKKHCGIEELGYLENLKGSLQISGLENVKTSLDAKCADLKSKKRLSSLSLQWSDNHVLFLDDDDEDANLEENILENLEPSDNLEELIIRNYVGRKLPAWIGNRSFSKLVSVIFDSCPYCSELPALGALPSLRYLSMQRLYEVDTMEVKELCGVDDTMEVAKFPSLELLNLWEMYKLREWLEITSGDFPCLRSVSINKCPLLETIPRFPSLVELSLYYCPQLLKIPDLYSLESLKIEGLQKAKCLDLPENLIALKKVEISYCSELESLQGLSKLTSIVTLKIIECPKLDIGDWQPSLLNGDDTSELDFEELDVNSHELDFEELDFNSHDFVFEELDVNSQYKTSKSGDKRVRGDQEEDTIMPWKKQVRRRISFQMVVKLVVMLNNLRNAVRRRVWAKRWANRIRSTTAQSEILSEVQSGSSFNPYIANREAQMMSPKSFLYQLIFKNALPTSIFTAQRVVDSDGNPLELHLAAGSSGSAAPLHLPLKIQLVVLDGDFPSNDDWTSEEFNNAIVTSRPSKGPLIFGDVNNIEMRDGIAIIKDFKFTDNSRWLRSGHFRIGARVVPGGCDSSFTKEAITDKFVVKDRRGIDYIKHETPALTDDVWTLETIAKGGKYHKMLKQNNIHTVQDFLKLWTVDQSQLRQIFQMSDKTFGKLINHAIKCDLGNKTYFHSGQNVTIFLNSICQVVRIAIDGVSYTLQDLPPIHMDYVRELVLEAYRQWGSLPEVDDGNISQTKSETMVQGEASSSGKCIS